jgi:hypothetical protein
MHLKVVTITHKISSNQVFHSFYEEMRSKFSISAKAKTLFLSLAESIAHTLNVTLCYVCGWTNMGDLWPLEARELNPQETFNETPLPKQKIYLALKNFHHQKLLYLPPRRSFFHPYGRFNLLRTEVLQ